MTDIRHEATVEEVDLLISEGEGLIVEFKERYTPRIDQDIVAFANARGGTLLLGVRDDGTERNGMGIQKMKEYMVAAGLDEPTFKPDSFFRAIFRRAPEFAMKERKEGSEKKFGEGSEKILLILEQRKRASAREIAETLGLTPRAVEKHIAALKTAGRLKRIGPPKGGFWEVIREEEN